MNQDTEQIKILAIFHFVVAAIAGLFACFPIFHLLMGLSMLTGGFFPAEGEMPFPFGLFGLMFTIIPAAMIFFGWAFAIALAISGYFLLQKKNYLFCLVMAGVSCVFMPFGTVLGVFTIIVLMRSSVKELFQYSVPTVQAEK
jgi:hypothetical protein